MKKVLLLALALFLFLGSYAYAGTYLVYDEETKEIISLSPEDDAQLEEGWEKVILPIEFSGIQLMYHPTNYLWKNGKFILNADKIAEKEAKEEKHAQLKAQEEEIYQEMRKLAIEKIKEKNPDWKEIKKEDL